MILKNYRSYIAIFPDFDHDVEAPISVEFVRLPETVIEDVVLRIGALTVSQYQLLIARYTDFLETWQGICKKAGMGDGFTSIAECEKVGHPFDWSEITILFTFLSVHRP